MNYLRENKRGFLFNVFFIGLFILVFNIFVFKNESNAMSTTMDISNLSEMQIQKLSLTATNNAQSNNGTFYQVNINAYVDTRLTGPGNRRTIYGNGEKVCIDVSFSREIQTVSEDVKMFIKFGDGGEIELKPEKNHNNGVLHFTHIIKKSNKGTLFVLALDGKVTDNNGNTINLGLQTGDAIKYSYISADSDDIDYFNTIEKTVGWNGDSVSNYGIKVYYEKSQKYYGKKNNSIKQLVNENEIKEAIINSLEVKVGEYAGKGEIQAQFENINEKECICIVYSAKNVYGESGKIKISTRENPRDSNKYFLCNSVGNIQKRKELIEAEDTIKEKYKTPFVTKSQFSINGNDLKSDINICSGTIKVIVDFNEDIYKKDGTKYNNNDIINDLVFIEFVDENGNKTVDANGEKLVKVTNNNQVTITYNIKKGDKGHIKFTINGGKVYDKVGHTGENKVIYQTPRFQGPKIIIDTTDLIVEGTSISSSPVAEKIYVYNNKTYVGNGSTISYILTFNKEVIAINNKIKLYGEDAFVERDSSDSKKIIIRFKIPKGANGPIKFNNSYQIAKDNYGNVYTIGAGSEIGKADTAGPSVKIIAIDKNNQEINDITNSDKITYKIEFKDYGSGVKKGSKLDKDNIVVTNGIITGYGYDDNIATVEVVPTGDGMQTLYVKENAITDNLGNGNNMSQISRIKINSTIPNINFETNGGQYVMPRTGDKAGNAKIGTKITASENLKSLEYAWTTSKDKPSNYKKLDNNSGAYLIEKTDINKAGTYYLHIKATSTSGNIGEATSNAFYIKDSQITLRPSKTEKTKDNIEVKIEYGECLTENRYAGFNNSREPNLEKVTVTENGIVHAEATDKAGNKVINEIQINNIVKEIPINFGTEQKTVLSTVNKDAVNYVIIKDGTNLENLLNTVQNKESVNITVKDKEDKDLQKTDIMKTGQRIYANGDTEKPAYVVIVKGDLNGDGKVDIFDMFEVNKYRINQLEPGIEQLIAGDLTGDSKLDIYDIFEINKVRIANVI